MFWLELVVVRAAIFMVARLGRGGVIGGLGLAVPTFVLRLPPTSTADRRPA